MPDPHPKIEDILQRYVCERDADALQAIREHPLSLGQIPAPARRPVGEFEAYVNHGAALVTPRVIEHVVRQLPIWKVEFNQIHAPEVPHLVDQLEFLADVVEDFSDGAYKDLPYVAVAQSVFALTYAHKKVNLLPDIMPNLGRADDASVVRAVLLQNERAFTKYAQDTNHNWERILNKR